MNLSHAAGRAGTFVLLWAFAYVIWVPWQKKWPRVALISFMLGTVELLYSGAAQLVHRTVEFVASFAAKAINMALDFAFSLFGGKGPSGGATHLGVVITAGVIISGVAVISLGYVIAHLAPDSWTSAGVEEKTFLLAFVFIALAGLTTGLVGQAILSGLSSLADGIAAPLSSLF